MSRPPHRRPTDARSIAEAAFKPQTPKAPDPPRERTAVPGARELVSLRLDQEVLEHFREGGPGWQERINAALKTLVEKKPI